MNNEITAQELKTQGATILKKKTKKDHEALITVHGKKEYAVLTMERYLFLKEIELEQAYQEVKADLKSKNFQIQTPEEHVNNLRNV